MKKRIIALVSVLALLISAAGCGNKVENHKSQIVDSDNKAAASSEPTGSNTSTNNTAPANDSAVQAELDNFAKDADKNVDMGKIEGEEIKGESDDDKADIGGFDVVVKNAVVTEKDGNNIIVVEFSFKNNTSQPTNFAGVVDVKAFQGSSSLPIAVTYSADGYDSLTQAQEVPYNETIKVQKAYILNNTDEAVQIDVKRADALGGSETISKTFNLK